MRGKFIVIEGTDGAGKGTQTRLLADRIRSHHGLRVETVSFPRYETPIGQKIRSYLRGEIALRPQEAAELYVLDRADAAPEIRAVLDAGGVVIADRYVTSNIAHQGARLRREAEREEFFRNSLRREYEENGIPQPHLTLVLHVTAHVSQANSAKRGRGKDVLEEDPDHLVEAEKIYLALPDIIPTPALILECMRNGEQMPIPDVHEEVWTAVQPLFIEKGLTV